MTTSLCHLSELTAGPDLPIMLPPLLHTMETVGCRNEAPIQVRVMSPLLLGYKFHPRAFQCWVLD